MESAMITLGIEAGIRGGLAVVDDANGVGTLVDAIDIPVIGSGARERVDVAAIRDWILQHRPALALIERAQAMPRQGASSGFKFGRATGALEAMLALCEIPYQIVEPSVWKCAFKLPGKDKEQARQRALELFPSAHELLARKKDHGRAEAALLALHGIRNFRHQAASPGAQTGLIKQSTQFEEVSND
jgi:crossover junction endodeoxyribonuclease RuvC